MNVHSIRGYANEESMTMMVGYLKKMVERKSLCKANAIKAHSHIHIKIWRRQTIHNRQQILALHLRNERNAKHFASARKRDVHILSRCQSFPLLYLLCPVSLSLKQGFSIRCSFLHIFRMFDALSNSSFSFFSPSPCFSRSFPSFLYIFLIFRFSLFGRLICYQPFFFV